MPTVRDVLQAKGEHVYSINPNASVLEAVQKMNEHQIGALVVMEGDHVAGIFTERDVLRRVVGVEKSPSRVLVASVMTPKVICCAPDADLDDVSAIMKSRRIRHVPVCNEHNQVTGMVSIGDINAAYASNQEATIHFLNDYIFGRS